ncbi:DNA-directed RNA polymerase III subunit rpc8 [Drechslerella dactyloides]|uniref:DNA-directed RNA polymerase subunit n=1 Tax=Drechslerella dactyloides TaxID=74499 RepID=A0AAD6ISG4_DREDA|nr:DNA-directed RNA polymerase III subunit rpc8 [Drechslerella dactyloides]
MFILTRLTDLVTIQPSSFTIPTRQALEDQLNARYANKVIHKIGLAICLYDILKSSDGLIGPGSGAVNVNVEFRLIVFRPFKGEVIAGRISNSTPHGIHVRLDFFDEIFIPKDYLFEGSHFDHSEQVWVWRTEDGDELFFDKNELVRFRVEEEEFTDNTPVDPALRDSLADADLKPPYKLIVGAFSDHPSLKFHASRLGGDLKERSFNRHHAIFIYTMTTYEYDSEYPDQTTI